jgi:hypothetical protein
MRHANPYNQSTCCSPSPYIPRTQPEHSHRYETVRHPLESCLNAAARCQQDEAPPTATSSKGPPHQRPHRPSEGAGISTPTVERASHHHAADTSSPTATAPTTGVGAGTWRC